MKRLSNMAKHGMSTFTVCFIAVERRNQDLGDHMILVQLYERRYIPGLRVHSRRTGSVDEEA